MIIKIQNKKDIDYIDLNKLKFSNKSDFGENLDISKCEIILQNNSKLIIDVNNKLKDNIEKDIKYIKIYIFNNEFQKFEIREYFVKYIRFINVITDENNKMIPEVKYIYVLHNTIDYAFKHYIGMLTYSNDFYIDGKRMPNFYMLSRMKMNKIRKKQI